MDIRYRKKEVLCRTVLSERDNGQKTQRKEVIYLLFLSERDSGRKRQNRERLSDRLF